MSAPRFNVGQSVRIADRHPTVHHRVPAYAKGRVGVIERVCGRHGRPETFVRGDGEPLTHLYRVRLRQPDIWPDYAGSGGDTLDVEVFEHWLNELA